MGVQGVLHPRAKAPEMQNPSTSNPSRSRLTLDTLVWYARVMIVQKCYQYRIYPTSEQEEQFRQFSGCRRVVWNWAPARRIEHYKQTGKSLSFEDQCKELTLLKQQE
ncbi:MAG: transposase, OrfB family, central region, partial [Chthonomonadales bacterium]|nr:transposase, OrfB family, central region [Chthonomonadales bacterium]